jgi:hypothetical protein
MPHDASHIHHLASWARAKDKHGEARALFCRKLMEAQEARKKGSDTKQNNGGGRLIMQAKEWL